MRKNKIFAAVSLVLVVTVFGVLIFSVSASEDAVTKEETAPVFGSFHGGLLQSLTDEQRETLKTMIEANRAEIQNQLQVWGVNFSELSDEQHEILKAMIEENHAEIEAQLEEWGIEIPTCSGPMGLLANLTDEQKEELQTMQQNFQDAVNAKLEEWGVDLPEFGGAPAWGMGFHERPAACFGPFRP